MPTVLSKLIGSSTAWLSVLLPILHGYLKSRGILIPWELTATTVGAYAAKESARYLGPIREAERAAHAAPPPPPAAP